MTERALPPASGEVGTIWRPDLARCGDDPDYLHRVGRFIAANVVGGDVEDAEVLCDDAGMTVLTTTTWFHRSGEFRARDPRTGSPERRRVYVPVDLERTPLP